MAMGKQKTERQQERWIAATEMPEAPWHPVWRALGGPITAGYWMWRLDPISLYRSRSPIPESAGPRFGNSYRSSSDPNTVLL